MNELIIRWKNGETAIYRFTTKGNAVAAKMILENHCGHDIKDMKIQALEAQPCEDCISRQAVIDLTWDWESFTNITRRDGLSALKEMRTKIEDLPSVTPKYTDEEIDRAQAVEQAYVDKMVELAVEDAKRPKGRWIGHREHCENLGVIPSGLGVYEWCSNCDCGIDIREWQRNHYNYCPNCGAKMEDGG